MGCCVSLCCIVCYKYTFFADSLTQHVSDSIAKNLSIIKPTKWSLKTWYITLDKDKFKELTNTLRHKLFVIMKEMNLDVFNKNGYYEENLSQNLAYYIVNIMIDEDFEGNNFQILNIPTNTLFYDSININIDNDKIISFQNSITTIINKDNQPELIDINTDNRVYQKIFDKNLESKLINTINNIPNERIEFIIKELNNKFKIDEEAENEVLSKQNYA
jgi:hypothetical protein